MCVKWFVTKIRLTAVNLRKTCLISGKIKTCSEEAFCLFISFHAFISCWCVAQKIKSLKTGYVACHLISQKKVGSLLCTASCIDSRVH